MAAHVTRPLVLAVIVAGGVAIGAQVAPSLPPVGLAVEQDDGRWCAEFPRDVASRIAPGTPVAVVFPDAAESLVWQTRAAGTRASTCQTAFPQLRWDEYVAFELAVFDAAASLAAARKTVGLAVASETPWRRTAAGTLRADLDGDGSPEEARRCAADEGEHFTIWTIRRDGGLVRRAHEYFDWGAFTERTCEPGEDGR